MLFNGETHRIINNANYQTTTRTCRNVLIVLQLSLGDLKSISTRAWVMEDFFNGIPSHVFDLDFVVVCSHCNQFSGGRVM